MSGKMSESNKANLSKVNKARWNKIRKYAKYLGLPLQEINYNFNYLIENFTWSNIRSLSHHTAEKILSEGRWKKKYKIEDLMKANNEQQSDYVKGHIAKEKDKEDYCYKCGNKLDFNNAIDHPNPRFKYVNCPSCKHFKTVPIDIYLTFKETVEALKINYEALNTGKLGLINKNQDPTQDLKVAFWFINKMGGINKAKKIFEAATLAIEAMKS